MIGEEEAGTGVLQGSGGRGWLTYKFKVHKGYLREKTQQVGLKNQGLKSTDTEFQKIKFNLKF